ncbi:MAG: PolC-type DNA polymerase III [Clostridiales bacterium]|nr:PolC-type DNA polymerase III [Clostridiales bacterium]
MFDDLKEIKIDNVKFLKKSNILEFKMILQKTINLESLVKLEKYIINKLNLNDVIIDIEYIGMVDKSYQDIDFDNVFTYLMYKHPAIKGLLSRFELIFDGNKISIKLGMKSKEILKLNKIDKLIEDIIFSNYGLKVKIDFIDGDVIEYDEELEKRIVRKVISQNEIELSNREEKTEKKEKKESSKNNVASSVGDMPPMPDMPVPPPPMEAPIVEEKPKTDVVYGKGNIKESVVEITSLNPDADKVAIIGTISNVDSRELKSGKFLIAFDIYDGTSSITAKLFAKAEDAKGIVSELKDTKRAKIAGSAQYDNFAKELGIICNNVVKMPEKVGRKDLAEEKRVELHLHTKMSAMDGVTSATDMIKTAAKWGHKAIAITDHGVVQAFPEAHNAAKKAGIKVLYGVEAYLVSDKNPSVYGKANDIDIDTTYVVLDIETTGFSAVNDKITEFGMIKVKNGEILEEFETFVNPQIPIPEKITEVTNITDEMVKDAPTIEEVMPKILEFIGDSPIVAHNANFDLGFIKYNAKLLGKEVDNVIIDTLQISRDLEPDQKKHKLGIIADRMGIVVENAHRALDDVKTLVQVFDIMIGKLKEKGAKTVADIDLVFKGDFNVKSAESHHATILVKDYVGLKNLYKLVSFAHIDYFFKKPRIPKSVFKEYSEGLLLGSACEQGEIYKAIIRKKTDEEIEKLIRDYDYIEIMPDGNNEFMLRNGIVANKEELHNINKKLIYLAEKNKKIVVATGDAHFLNPEDEVYRRILMYGQGFSDADLQAPLYFRTTDDMLDEFSYLGSEKAYEYVVTNTNKIADMCEEIQPVPDGTYPPRIPGAEEDIERIAYTRAKELYGDPLPEIVQKRLEKELNSIIKNGFSVMYIIAQKLVWKSNEDGYLVGSRGSVGSSFVANMTGITEVNSLPPHYRCPSCKYSDFDIDPTVTACGFDLPDKECPKCGARLDKDGIDIPFETFLGFDGDKAPDIDLNFSGDYQAKAHKYTEVLFGEGKTFKAGTIGTLAEKTAYGFVKKYYDEKNMYAFNAELTRLARGCEGVKRTTGQHPGGIIVVPDYKDIYDFCPVQYPADDSEKGIKTTHFDFHSIHDNLLKLDILGHDDPTVIRMLEDLTGVNAKTIPLDDKKTMSLFTSTEALGVTPEQINSPVGSFAVPEFGTKFVRQMLVDTKPTTFSELIRISGLSHGTDVWLNNAQTLILEGTATLPETICTRDDIMLYLIQKGMPPKLSFKTMESVRKGKGLTEEMETSMKEHDVPDWYIKSCKKIKYMFPKAHAAAYVTMAYRIAWFKVYHPKAFYTAYFTVRADEFDANIMTRGKELVKSKIKELEMQGNNLSMKDKNVVTILEVVNEMYERGINFLPITLKESHATKFIMEEDGIRPPLNALPGLGTVAAEGIYNAMKDATIELTVDDLKLKAKIGKSVIEILENEGCLKGMLKTNQYTLF